jgi:hypothetical protein
MGSAYLSPISVARNTSALCAGFVFVKQVLFLIQALWLNSFSDCIAVTFIMVVPYECNRHRHDENGQLERHYSI